MFLDDLPVWGFVGEAHKDKDGKELAYIFTHKAFDISYNKDRVRAARVSGAMMRDGDSIAAWMAALAVTIPSPSLPSHALHNLVLCRPHVS